MGKVPGGFAVVGFGKGGASNVEAGGVSIEGPLLFPGGRRL